MLHIWVQLLYNLIKKTHKNILQKALSDQRPLWTSTVPMAIARPTKQQDTSKGFILQEVKDDSDFIIFFF